MGNQKVWNPSKDPQSCTKNRKGIRVWRNMRVFDGIKTLPHAMALTVENGKITRLQPEREPYRREDDSDIDQHGEPVQLAGYDGLITPGFIDCHTHIIYAGSRLNDFVLRTHGASYEQIARNGGGILSTLQDTRAASEEELLEQSLPRLDALIADGVTSVEIKSGYGLTLQDELKMLRVARQMEKERNIRIVTTLLAAHALPPEYKGQADDYIELVCNKIIPAAASENLADMVDVFCESIAFSPAQCERVFQAAQKHDLPIKAHVEQLSRSGGAELAARYGAVSVDHIEYLDESAVVAMQQAGTVAVLLPGAFYMLREKQTPPLELLRKYKIPVALATDANPGSSPIFMPSLILNMGCILFGLSTQEALRGFTVNAGKALKLDKQGLGFLMPGSPADFCVWNSKEADELCYIIQPGRLRQRVFAGVPDHVV